ncbi:MAG TPA: hypothetical protein VGJ00_09075 [Rhabdochlamydiaceae bacterium]|jgi:hypothetical protein
MKKWLKSASKYLILILFLWGICLFCEWKTQGFRPYRLLSNLKKDPCWDTPALSTEEKSQIEPLLFQKFTYLGRGSFCYAFLGEDQKTVIKFFAHPRLSLLELGKNFVWEKLLLKTAMGPAAIAPHFIFCFHSCKLLYTQAKKETGLLYVHLNRTSHLQKHATLVDKIGIAHEIDLNQTHFVLQQKAELLTHYIARSVQENHREDAKCAIDKYLECLRTLCQHGLRDLDRSFKNNYAILPNGAVIAMDISSFTEDPHLQRPAHYKKEILLKSQNLSGWLKRRYPDLFAYYDEKTTILLE